jgi:alpha-tubulin suppressor-like RCC1 family protein
VASSHSCAIVGGTGYCWGGNRWGSWQRQGRGSSRPGRGGEADGVQAIDGGDRHTCAVLADGSGYCWGGNQWGQLGNDVLLEQINPTKVSLGVPVTTVN